MNQHGSMPITSDSAAQARPAAGPTAPGEAMHRAILESVLDPTITIDAQGEVMQASDSVEKAFGWKPAELVGRNIRILMPEPHSSSHDQYLANYRRTGITHILNQTREFQVKRKNGELFDVELSVSRTEMPDGLPPVFTGSFRDISDRKRVEQALRLSERRFRALFDQSFQYAALLEPDGTMIEVNRALLATAGAVREALVGKPFWALRWFSFDRAAATRCEETVARAAAGEFVRFDVEIRGEDDSTLSIDFSLSPVRDDDGAVVMLIAEARDITELRRAQRTETQMLRALATLGENAAVLAHEIKNPITAVNIALRAVADQLGQDQRVVLEDLSSRMMRLERMLRRTLSFVRPVELRLGTVDMVDSVNASIQLLRPMIVASSVDVRTSRSPGATRIVGDRALLEEVITNLLANAVEALEESPPPRIVEIRLEVASEHVHIAIEDNGPGVPESLRNTLFQPYVTTKSRGTGLGLAFCKKVIDEHHGSIVVGVAATGGARFELTLPTVQTHP